MNNIFLKHMFYEIFFFSINVHMHKQLDIIQI